MVVEMTFLLLFLVALLASAAAAQSEQDKAQKGGGRGQIAQRAASSTADKPLRMLKILLVNDDGFESGLIQAVFRELREVGHDVIMCAPYQDQSGTAMSIDQLRPLTTTKVDSPGGTIQAGAPAFAPTGIEEKQWYVDSTPVAATLFGLDILAKEEWGEDVLPDLVVSGPNEGFNLGYLTSHSGTVGAALTGLLRGIPSIAISTKDKNIDDKEKADMVAKLCAKLVNSLAGKNRINLPRKMGLNVNIPLITSVDVEKYLFVESEIGSTTNYDLQAFASLAESPIAQSYGAGVPYPGVSVSLPYGAAGYPTDNNAKSEGSIIFGDDPLVITMTPIQGTFDAPKKKKIHFRKLLRDLISPLEG